MTHSGKPVTRAQAAPETLEALGDFAAKIGHDVNNILGSIRGCIDLIKIKVDRLHPDENPVARQIAIIEAAISRGSDLTQKLRSFVRSTGTERVTLSLDQILEQAVDLLGKHSGNVEITLNVVTAPRVAIEEFAMTHLVVNICTNACEAMQQLKDAQLVIHLDEEVIEKGEYGLAVGRYARVAIIDHGVGIAREARERIFEPFFSTKKGGVGEGIGLSLSMGKELLRRHGGDLIVSSEKNVGTAVKLYLPVEPEEKA